MISSSWVKQKAMFGRYFVEPIAGMGKTVAIHVLANVSGDGPWAWCVAVVIVASRDTI